MESYGSIGSPDGNRINRKHLSPYGPGQWMRWRWVAPGKGGIHHWCQSFLLNLEALESLEARNCDANFPKKKRSPQSVGRALPQICPSLPRSQWINVWAKKMTY